MAIQLPAPIADYFAADRDADASAVSKHFTEDAIVKDEGHSYAGRAAIRQWKASSSEKYNYTAEPVAIMDEGGMVVVTARLTGDFPGSPVDLRYRFALQGGQIAALEVTP